MACLFLVRNAIFFSVCFYNNQRTPIAIELKSKKERFYQGASNMYCVRCVLLECIWGTGWWCIELYHHDLNAWLFCCINSMWFGLFSFNSLNIECASFHSFEFFLRSRFLLFWNDDHISQLSKPMKGILFHWIHKLLISQRVNNLTMTQERRDGKEGRWKSLQFNL